ncbi:MAG: hypothetical protein JSS51_06215 [Planctomycetes bacterium]|nr:hypothetical protein [Planctomycetota bacterium]
MMQALLTVAIAGGLGLAMSGACGWEGWTGSQSEQSEQPASKDRPHATFRIIAENTELAPGKTEMLGLQFKIEPHWHLYYNGAPGSGNPPQIEQAKLPPGYSLGPIQWPAPKRYVAVGGIYDSVYENEVTLLVPLNVPSTAQAGDSATISLKLGWLECSDVCVFGKGEDTKVIKVGTGGQRSADAASIDRFRALLPQPWPASGAQLVLNGSKLQIKIDGATRLEFYPGPDCSDIAGMPEANVAKGDSLTLTFEGTNKDQATADGVLGVWRGDGAKPEYYRVNKSSSQ